MRLIDIEAEVCADCVCRDKCDRQAYCWAKATQTVEAVLVVYCKDCKHYEMGVCLKIYSDGNAHPAAWQKRKPEDFCSYGERRGGGEDD